MYDPTNPYGTPPVGMVPPGQGAVPAQPGMMPPQQQPMSAFGQLAYSPDMAAVGQAINNIAAMRRGAAPQTSPMQAAAEQQRRNEILQQNRLQMIQRSAQIQEQQKLRRLQMEALANQTKAPKVTDGGPLGKLQYVDGTWEPIEGTQPPESANLGQYQDKQGNLWAYDKTDFSNARIVIPSNAQPGSSFDDNQKIEQFIAQRRDEYDNAPEVQDWKAVRDNIRSYEESTTAALDKLKGGAALGTGEQLDLIIGWYKIQDPTSTVTGGEASSAADPGLANAVTAFLNRVKGGSPLTADQIASLRRSAFGTASRRADIARDYTGQFATQVVEPNPFLRDRANEIILSDFEEEPPWYQPVGAYPTIESIISGDIDLSGMPDD